MVDAVAIIDEVIQEEQRLRMARSGHEATWQQIYALIYPNGVPPWGITAPGAPVRQQIVDNTAEDAHEMAAAGLIALLTNPSVRWFELGIFNQRAAMDTYMSRWLAYGTSVLFALFRHPESQFQVADHEHQLEQLAIGNACTFVEDRPGRLPLYRNCPMAEVVWCENDDGIIDTLYRRFCMTAKAAVQKWGMRLPSPVIKKAEKPGTAYDHVEFIDCVKPRQLYAIDARGPRNMPFQHHVVCTTDKGHVLEGGYQEFPYVCSRWKKRGGELYGRGAGHKALPDADTLQRMVRTLLASGETMVAPPILAPDQGMTGPFSLKSAAINTIRAEYLSNNAYPRPFRVDGQWQLGFEFISDRRTLIRRAFLEALLQLIRDPRATATHVLELKEEQNRGLSPILGRQEVEYLGGLVGRSFAVCQRAGFFEIAPPMELVGQQLAPTFKSPAARAQQLSEAKAVPQAVEAMQYMLEKNPALLDNLDDDQAFRRVLSAAGASPDDMRPLDQVDAMRQARQKAAAEREQLEGGKDLTTMLKNSAPMVRAANDASQAAA